MELIVGRNNELYRITDNGFETTDLYGNEAAGQYYIHDGVLYKCMSDRVYKISLSINIASVKNMHITDGYLILPNDKGFTIVGDEKQAYTFVASPDVFVTSVIKSKLEQSTSEIGKHKTMLIDGNYIRLEKRVEAFEKAIVHELGEYVYVMVISATEAIQIYYVNNASNETNTVTKKIIEHLARDTMKNSVNSEGVEIKNSINRSTTNPRSTTLHDIRLEVGNPHVGPVITYYNPSVQKINHLTYRITSWDAVILISGKFIKHC